MIKQLVLTCVVLKTALSIPASSDRSMARKSPTVWVTGFRVNTQGSLRDGKGTTICGRP